MNSKNIEHLDAKNHDQHIINITDEVDAPSAMLFRLRHAAEAKGQGRIYGAAAKANLRNFGAAMDPARATPVRTSYEVDPRQMGGYSGARESVRDPQVLGPVMKKLLSSRGWRTPVNVWSVMEKWPDIVGDYIAANCVPEVFENTVLKVRCSSTVQATNLRMIESEILKKISDELGQGIVTRLDIRGPVAPSWKRGPRTVRGRGPRDTYG